MTEIGSGPTGAPVSCVAPHDELRALDRGAGARGVPRPRDRGGALSLHPSQELPRWRAWAPVPRAVRLLRHGRPHLVRAARYVELNPVSAGVVAKPADHAWSSARLHLGRRKTDPLNTDHRVVEMLGDCRSFLREGVAEEDVGLEACRVGVIGPLRPSSRGLSDRRSAR